MVINLCRICLCLNFQLDRRAINCYLMYEPIRKSDCGGCPGIEY